MDDKQTQIAFPPKMPRRGDLTPDEQRHVKAALHFLRIRAGSMARLAKCLRTTHNALSLMAYRRRPNASLAVRLARFAGVTVDDVLNGRFPAPGTCPHCGQTAPTP